MVKLKTTHLKMRMTKTDENDDEDDEEETDDEEEDTEDPEWDAEVARQEEIGLIKIRVCFTSSG